MEVRFGRINFQIPVVTVIAHYGNALSSIPSGDFLKRSEVIMLTQRRWPAMNYWASYSASDA